MKYFIPDVGEDNEVEDMLLKKDMDGDYCYADINTVNEAGETTEINGIYASPNALLFINIEESEEYKINFKEDGSDEIKSETGVYVKKYHFKEELTWKWFVIKGGLEKKADLEAEGIPINELTITMPINVSGIAFPEKYKKRAQEIIGFAEIETFEHETNLDQVVFLSDARIVNVTAKTWRGEKSQDFIAVTKEVLSAKVNKDIIISVPHGVNQPPIENNAFNIYIWSSPDKNQNKMFPVPSEMWGIGVDCRDHGFEPSGLGMVIYDDAGSAVGEYLEDNLYIFHDICDRGTPRETEIYKKILQEAFLLLNLSPEEKEIREREIKKTTQEKSREIYTELCVNRIKKIVDNADYKIREGQSRIKDYQKALVKTIQEVNFEKKQRDAMTSMLKFDREHFSKEFDQILSIAGIEDVKPRNGFISFFTEFINIEHEGEVYKIGKFRIDLSTDGQSSLVKMYNLTNRGQGPSSDSEKRREMENDDVNTEFNYHHPHIAQDGYVCLGNIEEAIAGYIGEQHYDIAAIVLLKYLKSVNMDDRAGQGIKWWPKEEKEKKENVKGKKKRRKKKKKVSSLG